MNDLSIPINHLPISINYLPVKTNISQSIITASAYNILCKQIFYTDFGKWLVGAENYLYRLIIISSSESINIIINKIS